jgi:hypothetical protein
MATGHTDHDAPGGPSEAPASDAAGSSDLSKGAYDDLRRLIPSLAAELDLLRASLREHNLWLLRYGHSNAAPADPGSDAPDAASDDPPPAGPTHPNHHAHPPIQGQGQDAASELPAYSASDVPPYRGKREEVADRRDQLMEWLKEGEDVLRDYSARFAQLAAELRLPAEDLLGTWREAAPDNALPDYEVIEPHEELMVGGVGEVPPPYVRGSVLGAR